MDMLTREARSRLMSRIGPKDTHPEMVVRRVVHGLGYRYVLHDKRLPGTPDLVLPCRRKVIFVNGCFWHGHSCGRGFEPKSNQSFWSAKIASNRSRDARRVRELRREGWKVLTVWECATVARRRDALRARLIRFLKS
jgi:DNA mismatch endonuclease (patch repair protein)